MVERNVKSTIPANGNFTSPETRFAAAFNPSTPTHVREELLQEQEFGDFTQRAEEATSEVEMLYLLLHRENGTCTALAENENTPAWILNEIYNTLYEDRESENYDSVYLGLLALIRNVKTPLKTLEALFEEFIEDAPESYCCLAVKLAENKNITSEILERLAQLAQDEFDSPEFEEWQSTLCNICVNPNASKSLKERVYTFLKR